MVVIRWPPIPIWVECNYGHAGVPGTESVALVLQQAERYTAVQLSDPIGITLFAVLGYAVPVNHTTNAYAGVSVESLINSWWEVQQVKTAVTQPGRVYQQAVATAIDITQSALLFNPSNLAGYSVPQSHYQKQFASGNTDAGIVDTESKVLPSGQRVSGTINDDICLTIAVAIDRIVAEVIGQAEAGIFVHVSRTRIHGIELINLCVWWLGNHTSIYLVNWHK